MKVVVLTAAYPSSTEPERAGFVENLTCELARDSSGIELSVVTPRVHAADAELEARNGIRVRRFRYPSAGKRLKEIDRPGPFLLGVYAFRALAAVVAEVRERGADLILAHWVLPSGPIARVAARRLPLPYVLVAHGTDVNRYAHSGGVLHWAARWAVARAARVVAVSTELRRLLATRLGAREASVSVLPMGVDTGVFRRSHLSVSQRARRRFRLGCAVGVPMILFVGDWLEAKGLLDLLEALSQVRQAGVVCETVLAGSGPLAPMLRARADECRLRLMGRLTQVEVAEWMEAAELLVLPSHAEGSPVSILEALTVGTPVVATRVGGIPEHVEDSVTGWLVPPREPAVLAATLVQLLSRPELLEAARARLQTGGRDWSVARCAGELRLVLEGAQHGV